VPKRAYQMSSSVAAMVAMDVRTTNTSATVAQAGPSSVRHDLIGT